MDEIEEGSAKEVSSKLQVMEEKRGFSQGGHFKATGNGREKRVQPRRSLQSYR